MKALEIAQDINYNQAQMYLNFGCFYQTLAEECKDDKLMRKAYSSYRKAFREGLKQGNSDELLNSFGNLTIVSARFHDLTNISSDWRLFQSTIQKHPKPLYLYTCYLYKGMLAKEKQQYDEALFWFRKQADITDDKDRIYIRNRIMMFLNIGEVLFLQHKYADAAAAVANGLRISRLLDIKDCKLQCYELMADYYAKAGNPSAAQQYKNQYYQLKDTLLNFQQLASVKDIQFLSQIKSLDEQISRSNMMNTMKNYIILVGSIVVVVILMLLIALIRRNKRLHQNSVMLYKKT